MRIRGIVRVATFEENPPGTDRIEMLIKVQGVGPSSRGSWWFPMSSCLGRFLEPEHVQGKGFEAEVNEDSDGRWIVEEIAFATGRVLRAPEREPASGKRRPASGDHPAVKLEIAIHDDVMSVFSIDPLACGCSELVG